MIVLVGRPDRRPGGHRSPRRWPIDAGRLRGRRRHAGASATPTAQAITGGPSSLPIIQVTDAIAVRDAGVDDRELAVQGWFASMMASCPAPNVNPINPLQVGCPDGFVWLMERARIGGYSVRQPDHL